MYNDLASALNNVPEEPTPPEPTLPSDGSYSEEKGVNTPNLGEGMTPIKWDATKNDWVETNGSDPEWYDYTAKKWANAKTSDGSMWVWIPRYAYSITSGYHSNTAGNIEIEFMKGLTNETSTGRTSFQNSSGQGNWNIHPAFNYGQEVSGLWVAKFEASPEGATTDVENSQYDGTDKKLQVKPGVSSWRSIIISNMYDVCKNYNSTLNSHMMKNDEWGSVAYLSKSKYGKNGEVDIKSNSSYYTGGGGGNAYVSNIGQSTTGTVHGVYDMSGGADEYVAAYIDNGVTLDTGASLEGGDTKTKNVYTSSSEGGMDKGVQNYDENSSKYGDAVYETSTNGSGSTSWYGDYSSFLASMEPFFKRGGEDSDGTGAGMFCFNTRNGFRNISISFRPVLVAL